MIQTMSTNPPYSQIVIVDPKAPVAVPEWEKGLGVVSTDTCILFACWPEMDGDTTFTLGNAAEVDPGNPPVFERTLKTPNRRIVLETVEGDSLLGMDTSGPETHVRIWANRTRSPDEVIVGID